MLVIPLNWKYWLKQTNKQGLNISHAVVRVQGIDAGAMVTCHLHSETGDKEGGE